MPPEGRYALRDGRVALPSLELHVVEHCNLRCRVCDVGSPLWPERFLSVAEVAALCRRLAARFDAEVFKIVGGEPLLHPGLLALLAAARAAGVGRRLRVTTNGLLLSRAPEALYRLIDELVISHYASAPVPPRTLALAAERAARHGVRLQVRPIDRFLDTLAPAPQEDPAAVQQTYDACWVRHCSPLVRDGVFYKCTRPAYLDDLLRATGRPRREADPPCFSADGVPLDAPDFPEQALRYLRSPAPLRACAYCLGSSGPALPHAQIPARALVRHRGRPPTRGAGG